MGRFQHSVSALVRSITRLSARIMNHLLKLLTQLHYISQITSPTIEPTNIENNCCCPDLHSSVSQCSSYESSQGSQSTNLYVRHGCRINQPSSVRQPFILTSTFSEEQKSADGPVVAGGFCFMSSLSVLLGLSSAAPICASPHSPCKFSENRHVRSTEQGSPRERHMFSGELEIYF